LISIVRSEKLLNTGLNTINEYYSSRTAEFGLTVKRAVVNAKDRSTVADVVNNQRLSIGGVNLNEEAANMVKAQKAFEAAARLMNVVDEMLNTIINGMGLVGR
jgi:flagellar hook-associated protein 1 FlgK